MIAIVAIEGVLANGDDLRNAQPTTWGRALVEGLHNTFRMVAVSQADPEVARWWLKREMMTGWAAVMTQEPYLDYAAWKVKMVEDFLAEGWEIGFMLDIDKSVLEQVSELGVLTLSVSYPAIKIGWRNHETTPRPWSEVSSNL